MDKIIMSKLDEVVYHEKLDNGLEIYLYKKDGFTKKGAYFVTKYGSATNDFKPIGEDNIVSFPKGIAHFLEHKLFESEDNEKVFEKFKKNGADVNAYTNHLITNYFFSTTEKFEECLIELLDFVQSPYFTLENVEKEKGIINQEINMTDDNIDRYIFEKMFDLTLNENPNKYKTIGDKENVSKITKEDLYRCYNTFYHPSNMILVMYGDVDVEKTFDLVRKNQESKNFGKQEELVIKTFEEEKEVCTKYIEEKRNVSIPRISICYKFKEQRLTGEDRFKRDLFYNVLLDMKFGGTSSFEKELVKEEIIKTGLSLTYSHFDDIMLVMFEADVLDKDKFIDLIDEKLKEDNFDEDIFELDRKALLTSIVKCFENPSAFANVIINSVTKHGMVINNAYDIYENYSFDEFKEAFKKLDFNNKSILYVTSKED